MKRSESGFATVFIALTLVAMLAASAFAIDLGQGFTSRRQMQNAADAAAMAATRALMKTRTGGATYLDPTTSVWAAARDTAKRNGADTLLASQCQVIRANPIQPIANCSNVAGWNTNASVAGVQVVAGVTNATVFGKAINKSTVTARATGKALMKPLLTSRGSPFVMCGKAAAGGWDILDANNVIKASAKTNPATHTPKYNLQESQAKDCGAGSTFKGKTMDDSAPMSIGTWAKGSNGNGNDHGIYDTVAGATPCVPPVFTDCDLVIPIADMGRSGIELHVVNFAVFHIQGTGMGNPKYWGELLFPGVPVTRGAGGSGPCGYGAACVIKLAN